MVKKWYVLFIIIASILWSADGVFRRNVYSLPPTVVVFYEHLFGLLMLLPFALSKLHLIKTLKRNDLFAFLWIALLSGVTGTVLYTAALGQVNYISYSVVVLLQQLEPLFVVIFARLVLKERITPQYALWGFVGIVAAYFLSFPTLRINLAENSGQIRAALFALGAAFCWGSSTAFSRYMLIKLPAMTTTIIRYILTVPIAFVFVFAFGASSSLAQVNTNQFMNLVAISLASGAIGLFLYYYGLKFTEAKVSAIAELTWPLSAVVIGFVFLGERLTATQFIGVAGLLIAMYQVSKQQKQHAETTTKI